MLTVLSNPLQDESYCLDGKTQSMKTRDKFKVTSTFHGAGMVVPYNKATEVGYRPSEFKFQIWFPVFVYEPVKCFLVPETSANLKKIFAKIVAAEEADEDTKNEAFDSLQELVS